MCFATLMAAWGITHLGLVLPQSDRAHRCFRKEEAAHREGSRVTGLLANSVFLPWAVSCEIYTRKSVILRKITLFLS